MGLFDRLFEKEIINILSEPRTTSEIAEKLDKSRSWTSYVLNLLEKRAMSGRRRCAGGRFSTRGFEWLFCSIISF